MEKKMYKTDFILRSIKERYNEYKKYPNILLNYNDILLFFPDYFKVKMELEKEEFVSKEEIDKEFNDNYKNSALYEKLVKLAMAEDEIYEFMNKNKDVKYMDIKNLFDKSVESSISLCELIDYIGHYPTTWPVPNEDEKNPAMEELLEKYELVPFCPEVEGGLPTPRVPSEIVKDKVINKDGKEVTKQFKEGASLALNICKYLNIKIAILKDGSPSCGSNEIHNGKFDNRMIKGKGITATLLEQNGIRVISENEIEELLK